MRSNQSLGMGVASCIIMVEYDNGAVDVVKIYPDRLQHYGKNGLYCYVSIGCKISCILHHFVVEGCGEVKQWNLKIIK